jgi:hypothetical protein
MMIDRRSRVGAFVESFVVRTGGNQWGDKRCVGVNGNHRRW